MVDDERRDFWAGLLYIAVGLAFAAVATTYPMGTASRIGPGYFPFGLGLALAGIGGFLVVGSRLGRAADRNRGPDAKVRADEAGLAGGIRVALLILAAVVAFGVLIRPAGLLVAVVVLVVVSSLAGEGLRAPLRTLLLALAAAGIAWAIFISGLGLPIQVWPAGLS